MGQASARHLLARAKELLRNDQLVLTVLALVVGAVVGGFIIVFRETYRAVQTLAYGFDVERSYDMIHALSLSERFLVPAAGGLLVGLLIRYVVRRPGAQTVADVIAANAARGGRMSLTRGLTTALTDCVAIGIGGSVGREGPAVHLGASVGGWLAKRLHLPRPLSRTLLGCGVAAAVAASFNVPIAGALFANEVVIGNYALHTFAPVVIASIGGTFVSRAYFGPFPAFRIAEYVVQSPWEMLSFAGLGLCAAAVAVLFIRLTMLLQAHTERLPVPIWVRTTLGGILLGAIALAVPEVLGVGYGVTEAALLGRAAPESLVAILVAKFLATVACLGFGFAGGVFSPSVVIGSVLGGAYGAAFTHLMPQISSGSGAYAVVGTGAVAAAVLGAPISTTLIVFEMTGNYSLTVAVLLAASLSSLVARQAIGHSYFTASLARRGIDPREARRDALLEGFRVRDLMIANAPCVPLDSRLDVVRRTLQASGLAEIFVLGPDRRLVGTVSLADLSEVAFDRQLDDVIMAVDVFRAHPPLLTPADGIGAAMNAFRSSGERQVAVVEDRGDPLLLGYVTERDVLDAYHGSIEAARREESGG